MDVVFSAVVKQVRRAPLTQIVPHCGESEGGPHEVGASSTNLESEATVAAGDAKTTRNGLLVEITSTICEQHRSYNIEHESPITMWDIGAQLFVIVPCRDEAQRGVHGLGTNLGEIGTTIARKWPESSKKGRFAPLNST